MYLAQSLLDTSLKAVPVAALTTVVLGALLAPWIARRQEIGKVAAVAEVELRTLIVDMRANVMYARTGLAVGSSYDPERFTGLKLAEFTVHVVAGARKLPKRRQQKVAAALVDLVGEWRVGLAEEVGPAWLRSDEELVENAPSTAAAQAARMIREEEQLKMLSAFNRRASENGDENDGLLGQMAKSQLPGQDHPQAVASLDRLLDAAGGRYRLGKRR